MKANKLISIETDNPYSHIINNFLIVDKDGLSKSEKQFLSDHFTC